MTPEVAIKILDRPNGDHRDYYTLDFYNAKRLGVQALKRHQTQQALLAFPEMHFLPGETKH